MLNNIKELFVGKQYGIKKETNNFVPSSYVEYF